ncbi:MAG TPA: type II secretion system F family protein [Xanthobacteraceae bacterium]|nr:type II secretion system F family protein [Xanthobacteraceae bacterium]
MIESLITKFSDPRFMATVLAAVAAAATVITIAMPLLSNDTLGKRMNAVGVEREKIRQREREKMARAAERVSLRASPKQYMQTIVDQFNLSKWVGQEEARGKLSQAGFRGQAPYVAFLFFRMVVPVAALVVSVFYVFFVLNLEQPLFIKLGICVFAVYVGMQLPNVFLKNKIQKRMQSINRAFPDALDLLLICVESGMSAETAFRRVSEEIGTQSIALAEELMLLTAELSYLPDRRQAYENLAKRVDLESVRSVCMALQQSERYGTPMAQTLRVLAQENRDMRMAAAEKKAAGLPPKLTVPMIVFFLPVLFVVSLAPAFIKLTSN